MPDGIVLAQPVTTVTEHQIAEALDSLIREANAAFTSFNSIVQILELKLRVDLSTKLDFIRARLQHYFRFQTYHAGFAPQQDQFVVYQTPPNYQAAPSHYPIQSFAPIRPPTEGYVLQPAQLSRPAAPSQNSPAKNHPVEIPAGVPAKETAPSGKRRRGGPGGLNKPCGVSPELQAIVGQPTLPRTEIVKQLWAYIRKNNLQDPNNKRKIICNDELRLVFETDCTDMFKMNKLLAKHILPLGSTHSNWMDDSNAKKRKVEEEASESSKTASDDHVAVVIISEALASFFECEEKEMSEAEVLRQMWEYIKVNQLEDPMNPTTISCDAKLKDLLGCETVSALGIPEMLSKHHRLQ